ncbi:hypothetical protein MSHOH_1524 [Methanosarcina horonobensis HB-1 = JCM 15518]|uniref:Uncharacterized protein n=1 Tax=Methanosarcina horonobensis HB-1 = JCM 15518 TaxID=1434110 RepID=A0A0E3SD70_9EURY|nr:hypothetical protein MSHOH_1524 [Methanosarcina horonobensis HB-1 = JCM 15518]
MLSVNNDGGYYVPHVVFAPVELKLSRRNACGQLCITFYAVPAGLGMNPMELGADLLPSNTYQNVAFEIK